MSGAICKSCGQKVYGPSHECHPLSIEFMEDDIPQYHIGSSKPDRGPGIHSEIQRLRVEKAIDECDQKRWGY